MRLNYSIPSIIGQPRTGVLTTKATAETFDTGAAGIGRNIQAAIAAVPGAIRTFRQIDLAAKAKDEKECSDIVSDYSRLCGAYITENADNVDALSAFEGKRQEILSRATDGRSGYTLENLKRKLAIVDETNGAYVNSRIGKLMVAQTQDAEKTNMDVALQMYRIDQSDASLAAYDEAYWKLQAIDKVISSEDAMSRLENDINAGKFIAGGKEFTIFDDDEFERHALDEDGGREWMSGKVRRGDAMKYLEASAERRNAAKERLSAQHDALFSSVCADKMKRGELEQAREYIMSCGASESVARQLADTIDRSIMVRDAGAWAHGEFSSVVSSPEFSGMSSSGKFYTPEIAVAVNERQKALDEEAAAGGEVEKERASQFRQASSRGLNSMKTALDAAINDGTRSLYDDNGVPLDANARAVVISNSGYPARHPVRDRMIGIHNSLCEQEERKARSLESEDARIKDKEYQDSQLAWFKTVVAGVSGDNHGYDLSRREERIRMYEDMAISPDTQKRMEEYKAHPEPASAEVINAALYVINSAVDAKWFGKQWEVPSEFGASGKSSDAQFGKGLGKSWKLTAKDLEDPALAQFMSDVYAVSRQITSSIPYDAYGSEKARLADSDRARLRNAIADLLKTEVEYDGKSIQLIHVIVQGKRKGSDIWSYDSFKGKEYKR